MAQEAKQEKLVYPEPIVIKPSVKHTATILWLHGLGDSGKGWEAEMVKLGMLAPWIKFILPTAPRRSITCNGGAVMNGWYDIESLQNRDKNEYEGKQASVDYICGLIQSETKAVPSERIMVCGFSQGGAMSLYTASLKDAIGRHHLLLGILA